MVDMTNDVIRFEKLFADRFTEKDSQFMEIKSKNLPEPPVVHPWKVMRKQWVKRWDYGSRRPHDDRNQRERGGYRKEGRQYGSSHSSNRYRDFDRDNSRQRYRDRSQDERPEKHSENDAFDFQAALKAYQERF